LRRCARELEHEAGVAGVDATNGAAQFVLVLVVILAAIVVGVVVLPFDSACQQTAVRLNRSLGLDMQANFERAEATQAFLKLGLSVHDNRDARALFRLDDKAGMAGVNAADRAFHLLAVVSVGAAMVVVGVVVVCMLL